MSLRNAMTRGDIAGTSFHAANSGKNMKATHRSLVSNWFHRWYQFQNDIRFPRAAAALAIEYPPQPGTVHRNSASTLVYTCWRSIVSNAEAGWIPNGRRRIGRVDLARYTSDWLKSKPSVASPTLPPSKAWGLESTARWLLDNRSHDSTARGEARIQRRQSRRQKLNRLRHRLVSDARRIMCTSCDTRGRWAISRAVISAENTKCQPADTWINEWNESRKIWCTSAGQLIMILLTDLWELQQCDLPKSENKSNIRSGVWSWKQNLTAMNHLPRFSENRGKLFTKTSDDFY